MISFKQYITESDTESQLKKLGLKRGGKGYKIGKVMGDDVYSHKNYEDQFPQDELKQAKSHLPEDYKYHVVKYNPKTKVFSFIQSNDFDTKHEPSVHEVMTVKPDGTVKKQKDSGWIYHHKWQWVDDDYKGFDVERSKERSKEWTDIANEKGIPKSKIGQRKFWDAEVEPHLKKD